MASCKSIKLEHILTPYTKINSKLSKDLNITQRIKFLEKNRGKTFCVINYINAFLDQSPKAKEIKAEINKWNLVKLTSFCQKRKP